MKKTLLLLTAIALLIACKKDSFSNKSTFEDSYDKFIEFKKSTSNTYSYIATSASVFGYSSETLITVFNGMVTGRHYKAYQSNNQHQNTLYKEWDETSTNIGSHTEGQEAITLDEVYTKAKTEWLTVDKKTNEIFFERDSKGLMASCGYVPKGCQDDCFFGINIKSITSGQIVVN